MNMNLTTAGKNLLSAALAGTATIEFTHIELGNGDDAGPNATALSNTLVTASITSVSPRQGDIFLQLHSEFDNGNVAASFRATEVGVFATDPADSTNTILYAYLHVSPEDADYIPAAEDRSFESVYDVFVYVGEAENVTVVIGSSSYATVEQLEALQQQVNGINKNSIGLGNVPNVTTNDQTPTYTVASTAGQLVSGERLSVAFGKIARAISDLIQHRANKSNPHGVTPSQIGAASSSHSHKTSDITSGVLSKARGGTGNANGTADKLTTARTIRVNLGSTGAVSFDGSANVTPGVTGVLPIANGGTGCSTLAELQAQLGSSRAAKFVVGTSTAGWTAKDCDYLCDGTDDQAEINAALAALPSGGGRVLLLDGTYNLSGDIAVSKAGAELYGTGGARIKSALTEAESDTVWAIRVTANNCIVRGLILEGVTSPGTKDTASVFVASSVNRCRFLDNRAEKCSVLFSECTNGIAANNYVGASNSYVKGIIFNGGLGNLALGNCVTGAYYGIEFNGEKHFSCTGNTCSMNNEYGIHIQESNGFAVTGNAIYSNSGGLADQLYIQKSRNGTVSGNTLCAVGSATGGSIWLDRFVNFSVSGNVAMNQKYDTPIVCRDCTNGKLMGNLINGKSGITSGIRYDGTNTGVTAAQNTVATFDDSLDA